MDVSHEGVGSATSSNRVVVLDASNVAWSYVESVTPYALRETSNRMPPDVVGVEIARAYWAQRGCDVVAVAPHSWRECDRPDVASLFRSGVLFTSPKSEHDDHYIIEYAKGATRRGPCVVVSNDKFRDHVAEGLASQRWMDQHRMGYMFVGKQFVPNAVALDAFTRRTRESSVSVSEASRVVEGEDYRLHMSVDASVVRHIIGRGGTRIASIRHACDPVRVRIEDDSNDSRARIEIQGTMATAQMAKRMIEEIVQDQASIEKKNSAMDAGADVVYAKSDVVPGGAAYFGKHVERRDSL